MASIEENLRKKLYRAFCPDSMELDDYSTGELAEDRATYIRQHLTECPHCRREIEQLQIFLRETRPDFELNLAERIRSLVARLVKASGGPGWAPALQGLRGGEEHVLTYEAEGMKIILDVQADPERSDLRAIYGLFMGPDTADPQEYQARLLHEGEEAVSAEIDEFGNFALLSIDPGQYELVLAGPGVEIRIEELIIA